MGVKLVRVPIFSVKLKTFGETLKKDFYSLSNFYQLQHALNGLQSGGWDCGALNEAERTERQQLRQLPKF